MQHLYILFLIFFNVTAENYPQFMLKNYGPFVANVTAELCQGSKKNNVTQIDVSIYQDNEGRSMFVGNITTFLSSHPVLTKRHIYKWHNNRFESALPPTIYRNCDSNGYEFPLKNMKSVNGVCHLMKGETYINADFNQVCRYYMYDKFFYGKYKIIMEYYVKEGNIMCLLLYIDVNPA